VDVINELSKSNISYSRSDLQRLKVLCEQEIPVLAPSRLLPACPLFTQQCLNGKESALRDLLLPTTPELISSCGVPISSLTSFPLDSPRNYSLSHLLASSDPSETSASLCALSDLFNELNKLGSAEIRVCHSFPDPLY
jgi:hypothetical protein